MDKAPDYVRRSLFPQICVDEEYANQLLTFEASIRASLRSRSKEYALQCRWRDTFGFERLSGHDQTATKAMLIATRGEQAQRPCRMLSLGWSNTDLTDSVA